MMRFFYENRENEFYVYRRNHLNFGAHLHSQIEIVYIIKGVAHAFAAGEECTLREGDFFISFPNCIHYYDNCTDDIECFIAIIPYAAFPEYRKEFIEMLPVNPKIEGVSSDAVYLFERIIKASGKYKTRIIRAHLSAILGMIFEKGNFKNSDSTDNGTVQSIINYCRENYALNISLEDVSSALHISKSRISHIFSEKLHISFRSFINGFRLGDAEGLLVDSEFTVTEIAMRSGFENVRTFNRAFAKNFGCSPREYKKIIGEE